MKREPNNEPKRDGGGRRAKPAAAGHAGKLQGAMTLEAGSVHGAVAREIGRRILRGDYPPGAIIPNEAEWSQAYAVSRSAVREAIKMLTAKGLLSSRPKIGSRVEPRGRWNLLDRDVLSWYLVSPDRGGFLAS